MRRGLVSYPRAVFVTKCRNIKETRELYRRFTDMVTREGIPAAAYADCSPGEAIEFLRELSDEWKDGFPVPFRVGPPPQTPRRTPAIVIGGREVCGNGGARY